MVSLIQNEILKNNEVKVDLYRSDVSSHEFILAEMMSQTPIQILKKVN